MGELDLATSQLLLDTLSPVAEEGADLRLDLSKLTFIDSSGIRAVLIVADALVQGARVILESPSEPVLRTLRLMGLEQAENIEIS